MTDEPTLHDEAEQAKEREAEARSSPAGAVVYLAVQKEGERSTRLPDPGVRREREKRRTVNAER
jgi:hypothetical protein